MPPRTEKIRSENATFQRIEALRHNRNQRHRQRAFLVEGVRQIDRAIAYGWRVRAFIYPSDVELSRWATELLSTSEAEVHYSLPKHLHARLSGKHEPSELVVLAEMAADDLGRITPGRLPLIVLVDRSNSPGNLGTIIRSCDALGADGLILTGHSVDLYDPETIAASTGSIFSLPAVRIASYGEVTPFLEGLRAEHGDLQLIGTSAQGTRSLWECNFWRPSVLLVGNETNGLSHALRELADEMAVIPMHGSATSLNVANATSILLYEVQRQRALR